MRTIILTLFLVFPTFVYAETTSWLGPIEVISEKFAKNGGVLGFTHSLDQGDCCCGGPSTSDSYPTSLHVDEKGNIVVSGHDNGGQILIYSAEGKRVGEITLYPLKGNPKCTRWGSYLWPGVVNAAEGKIFVNPGCCTAVYDYNSKFLWEVYPDTGICLSLDGVNDKKVFLGRGKRGRDGNGDNFAPNDGWLIYSLTGRLQAKTTDPKQIYHRDETTGDLYIRGRRYQQVVGKDSWPFAFTDNKGQLFLAKINDQPEDFDKHPTYPAGDVRIFTETSVHIYTITLPVNRYVKKSRTCLGEDSLVFAGRDVIEEYGKGIAVGKDGSVYATLYVPDGLKIVKWVKVNLEKPLPPEVVARLGEKGVRNSINEIYARKGRSFTKAEVKATFDSQPWYRVDPSFSENKLSETDKENLKQLQDALQRKDQQKPLMIPR